MNAIEALTARVSPLELTGPGPDEAAEKLIFAAALRAPDHGRLRPWRFIAIREEARHAFGAVLSSALARRQPGALAEMLERERQKALRAPLILTVAAKIAQPSKIPPIEQILSAGAAAQNILIACHALGFAAVWKTGDAAYDATVKQALGLTADDAIVGFIYIGKAKTALRPPEPLDPKDFVQNWHA